MYGKYSPENHDITFLINYGKTSGNLNRDLAHFGIANQANLKSKFATLKSEYGYRFAFDKMNLPVKPFTGLMFSIGEQKPFTERGTLF